MIAEGAAGVKSWGRGLVDGGGGAVGGWLDEWTVVGGFGGMGRVDEVGGVGVGRCEKDEVGEGGRECEGSWTIGGREGKGRFTTGGWEGKGRLTVGNKGGGGDGFIVGAEVYGMELGTAGEETLGVGTLGDSNCSMNETWNELKMRSEDWSQRR
jgi:hypothetical protein